MMGGDRDAASKGICGIHVFENDSWLLVVDPHFQGKGISCEELQNRGYVKWMHTSEFVDNSFYNLCMPQIKGK